MTIFFSSLCYIELAILRKSRWHCLSKIELTLMETHYTIIYVLLFAQPSIKFRKLDERLEYFVYLWFMHQQHRFREHDNDGSILRVIQENRFDCAWTKDKGCIGGRRSEAIKFGFPVKVHIICLWYVCFRINYTFVLWLCSSISINFMCDSNTTPQRRTNTNEG
jgi:hypothetical protein